MKKILAVLCVVFFSATMLNSYFNKTQTALANGVIRFHVIANSDTLQDQELKLKVRDKVIAEMEPFFDKNSDIAMAREVIINNIEKIKEIAKSEIASNGYNYDVKVSLGKDNFPTKDYGDIVLPAGEYEALKIEIGKADGQNWWCVLFPPICMSAATATVEEAEDAFIAVGFTPEQYRIITDTDEVTYRLKFKFLEIIEQLRQKRE